MNAISTVRRSWRGPGPARLLQLRQLQRLYAGAGAGAADGGDAGRPFDSLPVAPFLLNRFG